MFQVLTILWLLNMLIGSNSQKLVQQIVNTQKLISLYEHKLQILLQMAKQQNISIDEYLTNTQKQGGTNRGRSLFKLQQQLIFQNDIPLSANSKYVFPNYITNNTQLIDLTNRQTKYQLKGDLLCIQAFQITCRKDNSTIIITKLNQKFAQIQKKMSVENKIGRWHHASQFQDVFLQFQANTLTLVSQKQTRNLNFKSQIVYIYSIHQYKILYVTRYGYGYLNPQSLQLSSETSFDSIVESAHYSPFQAILFIVFNDKRLNVIVQDKIVSKQQIHVDIRINKIQIDYLSSNYLFLYSRISFCFNIFQITAPNYLLSHYKEVCIPNHIFQGHIQNNQPSTQRDYQIQYKFFKNRNIFYVLASTLKYTSKLFHINLVQKQIYVQKSFPWKIIVIVICIVSVVYYRTRKSRKSQNNDQQGRTVKRIRKENKKQGQQKINFNRNPLGNFSSYNQNYIQNLNDQLKRIKTTNQNKKNL